MRRFVRPQRDPQQTAIMVAIAVALMLFVKLVLLEGGASEPPPAAARSSYEFNPPAASEEMSYHYLYDMLPEEAITVEEPIIEEENIAADVLPAEEEISEPAPVSDLEKWRAFAVKAPPSEGLKKIVIIIDDMGMNAAYTKAVEALPAPVTLAYLPYAPKVAAQAKRARKAGHELLIHTPMEPMSAEIYPGPIALLEGMDQEAIEAMLEKAFASFEGYVGINNHMGSRLTQNSEAMGVVMDALAARGLLFVDSKTIDTSVAARAAAQKGLYFAERDIFLDHKETPEFVAHALQRLENIAQSQGVAIGIGHPKKVTIDALKKWLPTLEDKGLVLVPVSDVVQQVQTVAASKH